MSILIIAPADEAILTDAKIDEPVFHQHPDGFGRVPVNGCLIMIVTIKHIVLKKKVVLQIYIKSLD